MAQPQLLSAFSMPCFGLNIHILDGDGQIIDTFDVTAVNGEGELTISPRRAGSVWLYSTKTTKVCTVQVWIMRMTELGCPISNTSAMSI